MSDVKLPADLYSPDQLSAVIMELRAHIGEQRNANARATGRRAAPQAVPVSALLSSVMHNARIEPGDVPAAEVLLGRLQALRANTPVAHITLADLPSRALKRQLTAWFRSRVHPAALLTFAVRADIGGGIVVQAGSHLYDFSFRQHVMRNRAKIGEIFDRVRK